MDKPYLLSADVADHTDAGQDAQGYYFTRTLVIGAVAVETDDIGDGIAYINKRVKELFPDRPSAFAFNLRCTKL